MLLRDNQQHACSICCIQYPRTILTFDISRLYSIRKIDHLHDIAQRPYFLLDLLIQS